MSKVLRLVLIVWVLPNSLIGLLVGGIGLVSGGSVQWRRGCLEFYGGAIGWMLNRIPPGGVVAMTLGHTIIGQTPGGLSICRDHEHVHVRQYERWGPFFIPAYLASSAYLWMMKRDSYRENPFEVEAFARFNPGSGADRQDEI